MHRTTAQCKSRPASNILFPTSEKTPKNPRRCSTPAPNPAPSRNERSNAEGSGNRGRFVAQFTKSLLYHCTKPGRACVLIS